MPIEFNAWQYVETDLWAALLSRIFDELSPEARRKLTELRRAAAASSCSQQRRPTSRAIASGAGSNLLARGRPGRRGSGRPRTSDVRTRQAAALETSPLREGAGSARAFGRDRRADRRDRRGCRPGGRGGRRGGAPAQGRGHGPGLAAERVLERRRARVGHCSPCSSCLWSSWSWTGVGHVRRRRRSRTGRLRSRSSCPSCARRPPSSRASGRRLTKPTQEVEDATVEPRSGRREEEQTDKRTDVAATRDADRRGTGEGEAQSAQRASTSTTMAARLNAGTRLHRLLVRSQHQRRLPQEARHRVHGQRRPQDAVAASWRSTTAATEAQQPDGPPNRIVLYIDDLDRCPPPARRRGARGRPPAARLPALRGRRRPSTRGG